MPYQAVVLRLAASADDERPRLGVPAEGAQRAASSNDSTSAGLTRADGSNVVGLHREASSGCRRSTASSSTA